MNGDGPDGSARVVVVDEHEAVPAEPSDHVGVGGVGDLDDVDNVDDLNGYDDRHDVDGFGVDPAQRGSGPAPAVTVAHNDGQVAHTVYGGLHQYVQRVRDYHELSDDYVRDRLDGFVEPGYHDAVGVPLDSDAAVGMMRHHGGVVLVGAPGTGRYTAALRLLHATGQQLREIRPTFDPGRGEQLTIAELPVAPGFAYLLELPEQAHHIQYGFARDLGGYCDSLARRGSSIAVVATDTTWAQLGALRDGPVLRVGTPPAGLVLDRRLRRLCPGPDLRWLVDEPQIGDLLTGAPPAEAVRLAQLAADVLTSSGALGGTGTGITADSPIGKEVVSALLSAYHNWEAELTAWFNLHADSRQRAFLVATAALEGSNAGQVLGAAEALDLRLTGGQEPAGLRHAGARALVADVDAVLDNGADVRFRRARYAQAVIDFVITDRADTFQRELWHWVCELPLRGGGAGGRVDRRLAARSAELVLSTALRRRTPEILSQVTAAWSHRSDLRAALVHVLGIAALSPEIGAAVRQQLYRWAQLRGRRKVLVTVAEVCGGQLADFYVDQALTRLGHLARHGLVEVDAAVLAALQSLWRRPALRQPVLLRLATWLAGDHPQGATLAAVALDVLGQPDSPSPEPADVGGGQLIGGGQLTEGARDWTAASERVRPPDQILAQIVEATAATQDDVGVALGRALDRAQLPAAVPAMLHRWFDDAAADADLVDTLTHVLGRTVTAGPAAARRVARLRALLAAWPAVGDESGGPERVDGLNASRRAALRRHLIHQLHRADPMTARRNSPPAQEP